jgi:EAL domain-containing protein (putative c-di-GMP-specific phosphodiesterase class I)
MKPGNPNDKPTKWYLEKVSDVGTTWAVPIEPFPFCIGRGSECNLTLRSKWISRRHAQIHLSGDILWLRDLGSTNGTLLNQKQVKETEVLEVGDHLYFGDHEFFIRSDDFVRAVLTDETVAFDPLEEQAGPLIYKPHLEKLLHNRNVLPHFQPIVNFPENRLVGYEILGRIAENGLPESAVELFNIASQLGHAAQLSALFREEGMRLGKGLEGLPELFVNTHPVEINKMEALEKSLQDIRKIAPSNPIVLEINEKAVTHAGQIAHLRSILADLDLKLAYDDFGVGQTRLVELAKLPPDYLKFDMSIIRNIHIAPNDSIKLS